MFMDEEVGINTKPIYGRKTKTFRHYAAGDDSPSRNRGAAA
jgi:hypothetical protein